MKEYIIITILILSFSGCVFDVQTETKVKEVNTPEKMSDIESIESENIPDFVLTDIKSNNTTKTIQEPEEFDNKTILKYNDSYYKINKTYVSANILVAEVKVSSKRDYDKYTINISKLSEKEVESITDYMKIADYTNSHKGYISYNPSYNKNKSILLNNKNINIKYDNNVYNVKLLNKSNATTPAVGYKSNKIADNKTELYNFVVKEYRFSVNNTSLENNMFLISQMEGKRYTDNSTEEYNRMVKDLNELKPFHRSSGVGIWYAEYKNKTYRVKAPYINQKG